MGGDGKKHFVTFDGTETAPLGITKEDNKYAMKNAAVRLWVLMADYNGDGKLNEVVVNNNCTNTDGSCFRDLYKNDSYYKTVHTCDTACSGLSDETCYQCLKTHYSQPICSRDNFSVRPYGVELTVKSRDTEIQKNDTQAKSIASLISGLIDDYTVEMTAKSANNEVDPIGYYFTRITSESRDIANNLFDTLTSFFGLKFDNSKVNQDVSKCADSNHKRFDPISSKWKLENDNVGNYDIVLVDKDWTLVDQARYPYKAPASKGYDDCIPNNTSLNSAGKQGCDVQSFNVNNDSKFNKIPVKFVPAKIDVQSIGLNSYPANSAKWAYMNNLNENPAMGAQFDGNITAINAQGKATSNFTAECFSQDVNLYTQYTSNQFDGKDLKAGNTDGTPLHGSDAINLHYAYSLNGDNSFTTVTPITKKSTTDSTDGVNFDDISQSQVTKDKFLSAGSGTLLYDLRYNISKLYYVAVKPIKILFVKLKSELLDDSGNPVVAWEGGKNTYPTTDEKKYFTGNSSDIDKNSFRFIYGRVYTNLESYDGSGKPVKAISTSSNFNAVAYSQEDPYNDVVLSSVLGNGVSGLSNWYLVKAHSVDKSDGQINEIKIKSAEQGNPTISKSKDILFDRQSPDKSGLTNDVTYSYNGKRSNKVIFEVYPSIWLKYNSDIDKAGLPQFVLNFVDSGYNWVGKGNTGNIINLPVTPNAKYR